MRPSKYQGRGEQSLLSGSWLSQPHYSGCSLVLTAARTCCGLLPCLLPTAPPGPFPQGCSPARFSPAWQGLAPSRGRTCHKPLFKFHEVSAGPFLQPIQVLTEDCFALYLSRVQPQFGVIHKPGEDNTHFLLKVTDKQIGTTGQLLGLTDPCGTTLVINLHVGNKPLLTAL